MYWQIDVMYQKVHDAGVDLFVKQFWDVMWNGDHIRGGRGSVLRFCCNCLTMSVFWFVGGFFVRCDILVRLVCYV